MSQLTSLTDPRESPHVLFMAHPYTPVSHIDANDLVKKVK